MATATRAPSGDQVGIPGENSDSCRRVTVPEATSTTETWARRHMPSTSKKAILVPSFDHDAPCGWLVMAVSCRSWPVVRSRIHNCKRWPPLSDE